jgi:hypothetical protein
VHLFDESLIENRLCHDVSGPGCDFAFEARDLRVQIFGVRVERATDNEVGGVFYVLAGKIEAFIQTTDDLH